MTFFAAHRACGILYRYLGATHKGKGYILPANVCHVVPMTFLTAGVPFTFVDIDRNTLCADERECMALLGSGRYEGLLFVRTYGHIYDAEGFFRQIKDKYPEVSIIDDRCLCEPTPEAEGDSAADMVLFSTGYAKYLEMKYGAYSFIKDETSLQRMHSVENLCFNRDVDIDGFVKEALKKGRVVSSAPEGWLDTSLMEEAEVQDYLQKIKSGKESVKKHKESINTIYRESLNKFQLEDGFCSWRFNIKVSNKTEVLESIFKNGLFASGHYRPQCSLFGHNEPAPVAEELSGCVINLFNDHYFTEQQAINICKVINQTATI